MREGIRRGVCHGADAQGKVCVAPCALLTVTQDMDLALNVDKEVPLVLGEAARRVYADAVSGGLGGKDFSSVYVHLERIR